MTRWPSAPALARAAVLAALALGLAAVGALVLAAAPAQARKVRVFAVQPKLDIAWMESRATYRAKMMALADRSLRGAGTPLVQRGADDFASHRTGRDLVVWPEDIGLFAALTGRRAIPARASGSLEGSIATVIGTYGPQNAYYAERFPAAAQRSLPVRLGLISLTDTFAHVAVETFAGMAARYGVWLEAGVNMAQSWKVVCDDMEAFNGARPARLPGGVRCVEENPAKVRRLGDPLEPQRDYVYEATTDRVSNMALLFDPRGRLVSKQVKEYLTPIELPGQLDLVPGRVTGGLRGLRTPVGTLGFVTSKDAWMPDVQAKLDSDHVDLLVQPEFFVGDLVAPSGMWAPDTLKASAYNNVLRMPSVRTVVMPELTGNIFNFSADAQTHFALKPGRGRAPRGKLVGQPRAPGLAATPWVVPDPARPGESFAARRARLGRVGQALAPGSGVDCRDPARPGPCENGHVEGVFRRDVQVAVTPRYRRWRGRRARTRFTRARPLAPARRAQRLVSASLRGRFGVAAFEERRRGRDVVLVVTTRDGGRRWSRPVRVARPRAGVDQRMPAVAVGTRRRVTVAWVDRTRDAASVRVAWSRGGRRFSRSRVLAPRARSGSQWKPALAAGRGETVYAAWVDERERSDDDSLPQAHVRFARLWRARSGPSHRLDTADPNDLAAKLDNSWAPRIAARGRRVLVTWLDFQSYDWRVFSRLSINRGAAFGPQVPVTTGAKGSEVLADSPDPALTRSRPLIAWTDWRKRDSSARVPHRQYDVFVAAPGTRNRQADPYRGRQVSTFSPSICAAPGGGALVAFQDSSRGNSTIRLLRVGASGARRGPASPVRDVGRRAGNGWRPRLACSGSRVLALWEDERDGPPQVYFASAPARRLR